MTDDLDARQVAKSYHLDVHVTIGIILRSFREKIISKELGIEKVRELKSKSSLFITQDLIDEVIKAIQNFVLGEPQLKSHGPDGLKTYLSLSTISRGK
ncbi:hypothetical protein HYV49_00400 [Candidatus Pacearchaeota archaeon]|nr:hypothetical protein [Candidatus Pacearchaeota archaeon]